MARPRKPDYLKVIAGTARPHRMNKDAPTPARECPPPPPHISDKAKSAWMEAAAIADRMGVLTGADVLALEMLAEAIADIRAARASLASPMIMRSKDSNGNEVEEIVSEAGDRYYWTHGTSAMKRARPEIADISDADRRIAMWCAKFGMSPSDRARVKAGKPETNDFAEFG